MPARPTVTAVEPTYPPPAPPGRGGTGWLVLAAVAVLALVLQTVGAALLLLDTRWVLALEAAVWGVFWWWVARGAWIRSDRQRPREDDGPAISARQASVYTRLALLCSAAGAIALALQMWVLR